MENEYIIARKRWLKEPNVNGVFKALRQKDGVWTDELVVQIHVKEKKPRSQLKAGEVIPPAIGSVKTDVVQSAAKPLYGRAKMSAVQGGLSIGVEEYNMAGTLGAVFACEIDSQPVALGLTCAHCALIPGLTLALSQNMLQPGRSDGGRQSRDRIGTPMAGWELSSNGDAAWIQLSVPYGLSQFGTRDIPVDVQWCGVSDIVTKIGRTTGTTIMVVTGTGVTSVDYSDFGAGTVEMECFMTAQGDPDSSDPIVLPGDSGALVYYPDTLMAAGLVTSYDGTGSIAYSGHLNYILPALGLGNITATYTNERSMSGSLNVGISGSRDLRGAFQMTRSGPWWVNRMTAVSQDLTEGYDPITQFYADRGIVFESGS